MENLAHIPSNMTNDECFRLTGALPTARIADLLDEGDRFRDAVQTVKEQAGSIRLFISPPWSLDAPAARAVREALKLIEDAVDEWAP